MFSLLFWTPYLEDSLSFSYFSLCLHRTVTSWNGRFFLESAFLKMFKHTIMIDSLTLIDSLVENRILGWIKISLRNLKALLHHVLTSNVVVELSDDILISDLFFSKSLYFSQKTLCSLYPQCSEMLRRCALEWVFFIYFVGISFADSDNSSLK